MKRFLPLLFLLLGLVLIARSLVPERNKTDFDLIAFGRLPVVVNGRVKPLDTVARTALVVLQSSQSVTAPDARDPAMLARLDAICARVLALQP